MMFVMHRYFKNAEDQLAELSDALYYETPECKKLDTIFIAVGRDQKWIRYLYDMGIRNYVIDMAHGATDVCIDTVTYIKWLDYQNVVMAGNVETYDGAFSLIRAGAEYIRVGLAGGSICSTHKNTAVGRPMISALMDCAKARDAFYKETGRYAYLIADGGIRGASDIAKAIAVGGDLVMCGKLFAATSEARGPFYNRQKELTEYDPPFNNFTNGEPYYVEYAGMASHKMRQHNGSHQTSGISIEGESGLIRYTGITMDVINNIEANLRASLSYVGARNWCEFKDKVTVARMSPAGILEKQTHLDINDKG